MVSYAASKVQNVTGKTLKDIIRNNVTATQPSLLINSLLTMVYQMSLQVTEVVDHEAGEYVHGSAYTNTLEGWFSLLERGVNGTFPSCKRRTFRPLCK